MLHTIRTEELMSFLSLSSFSLRPRLGSGARTTVLCGVTMIALTVTSTASAQTNTCRKEPCPRQDTASLSASYGSIQVSSSGRGLPATVAGMSGGPADAPTSNNSACLGFTGELPDHILTLAQTIPMLRVAVASQGDTTLLIHGPYGWTCNDDANGFNPALETEFPAGNYRIWVGSYIMGEYHDYTLSVDYIQAPTPALTPAPTPTPAPVPAPAPRLAVRGNFEGLDVAFTGATIDELHNACTSFAANSDSLDWVDDIVLNGASYRNSSRYWEANALCAIVALNARPEGSSSAAASVVGNLEGTPFEVHGTIDQVRAVLTRYLPLAVDMTWADDLIANGQTRHNSSGYWNAAEVVMVITSLAR